VSKETFARIITKDKVNETQLKTIVHFYHNKEGKLDIPLDFNVTEIEDIRAEFGAYSDVNTMSQNKSDLSKSTLQLITIIENLGIRSFLVEYIDDLDWATYEFIQFVVKDGKIIKESTLNNTNSEADLYSSIHLGYDYSDYIYASYKDACIKFSE